MPDVNECDEIIDSREVIERLEELYEQVEGYASGKGYPLTDEDRAELTILESLNKQGADASEDWECGATLIRDSYFTEYAQDLAEELGVLPSDYTWPTSCIDWQQAARELQMDYTPVEFNGVTYWVR